MVKNCFDYRLGDGREFSFWSDPWCEGQAIVEKFLGVGVKESGVKRTAVVRDFWRNGRWAFLIP